MKTLLWCLLLAAPGYAQGLGAPRFSHRRRDRPDQGGARAQPAAQALCRFRQAARRNGQEPARQGKGRPLDPHPRRAGRLLQDHRRHGRRGRRRHRAQAGHQARSGGRGIRREGNASPVAEGPGQPSERYRALRFRVEAGHRNHRRQPRGGPGGPGQARQGRRSPPAEGTEGAARGHDAHRARGRAGRRKEGRRGRGKEGGAKEGGPHPLCGPARSSRGQAA